MSNQNASLTTEGMHTEETIANDESVKLPRFDETVTTNKESKHNGASLEGYEKANKIKMGCPAHTPNLRSLDD